MKDSYFSPATQRVLSKALDHALEDLVKHAKVLRNAKVAVGKAAELAGRQVDIDRLIAQALSDAPQQVEVKLPPRPRAIRSDVGKLDRALANLLFNTPQTSCHTMANILTEQNFKTSGSAVAGRLRKNIGEIFYKEGKTWHSKRDFPVLNGDHDFSDDDVPF